MPAGWGVVTRDVEGRPKSDFSEALPEEVWREIFDWVARPQDLLSCCHANSLMWNGILERTKLVWLFAEIFPSLLPYLSKQEALLCRRVCKGWQRHIDFYLENHEYHKPRSLPDAGSHLPVISYCGAILYKQLYEVNLEGSRRIRKFMQKMSGHPRNPFLGRSVVLRYSARTTLPFLKLFGKDIWYLKIILEDTNTYYTAALLLCLPLVPNLRKLELVGGEYGPQDLNEVEQYRQMWDAEDVTLPHLESLTLWLTAESVHCIDEAFIMLQLMKRQQLKRLQVATQERFPWNPVAWLRLSELDITLHCNSQLENLKLLQAPLRRLTLRLNIAPLDWKTLGGYLPHVRETLQYLSVETFNQNQRDTPILESVSLPQLKTLQLVNCLNVTGQFVLDLGSASILENLRVGWDAMGRGEYTDEVSEAEQRRQIEQYFFETSCLVTGKLDLSVSFIWDILRKLKVFSWESYDEERMAYCTREMVSWRQRNTTIPLTPNEFNGSLSNS